jgi:hypothetical protein
MRRLAPILLLALASCTSGGTQRPLPVAAPQPLQSPEKGQGKALAYWVQLGPGGVTEARVVMSGSECPVLSAAHVHIAMQPRAQATPEFPLVCGAIVPPEEHSIELMAEGELPGEILPSPVANPQRILVLGDTGCRIKGSAIQACNDPSKWPFPGLAASAAKLKPDLIIHVGDYLYRENACPVGDAGCAGTPFGDNWPTWNADFFAPAQRLLSVAPIVFVRGNHEDCQRAGFGFMRMLAPGPFNAATPCVDHQPPFDVPLGDFNLVVMDNANAPDTSVDASAVPSYQNDIGALSNLTEPVWLVMHRPIWAAVSGPLGIPAGGNATLIAAIGKRPIPSPVKLMLAGHIHTFEAINYDSKVPPQIVSGTGGDNLDTTPTNLKSTIFQGSSGVSVKDGMSINGFGFLLMTKLKDRWTIDLYDDNGLRQRQCVFAAGRVDCPNPSK